MSDHGVAAGTDVGRSQGLEVGLATTAERAQIYRLRHETYARELGQHDVNDDGVLTDALDAVNDYLVVRLDSELVGFVSITPPSHGRLSIEKYVGREVLPFPVDESLYEVRLLTVVGESRGSAVTALLMLATFRYVGAHGGSRVVVMGRRALRGLYEKAGLHPIGVDIRSGSVDYELLTATLEEAESALVRLDALRRRVASSGWALPFPMERGTGPGRAAADEDDSVGCFHGGAFFDAVGDGFETLELSDQVVNADVLDAWFPPAPGVLDTVATHLPWLLRTSPPTDSAGLVRAIAAARAIPAESVLVGAGSSALIFLAFGRWLTARSRVLLLDPTYGEYAHVLERVVGCQVDRLTVDRADDYDLDVDELARRASDGYDLVVLVNPNSPTGRHVSREVLERALSEVPAGTRVWVDETYAQYVGAESSLERFAGSSQNVFVCTSMSKAYALSGARVAYLVGPAHEVAALRTWTPPWAVSLPAQVAAVRALEDGRYYEERYRETHDLRTVLAGELEALGVEVVPGVANFLLCHLPPAGPDAAEVVAACALGNIFLRDASSMGSVLDRHCLRIAVKDSATNARVVDALRSALRSRS